MTIKKTSGRLILKEIKFDQIYQRTVRRSNERSGKVHLPPELIGKHVYVIVDSKDK